MTLFTKACGLGNDFVILELPQSNLETLSQKIADRRYGIGCDQIIFYKHTENPNTLNVRFFNQDGSEAESCGNGTRCLAKWFMQTHNVANCTLNTLGGIVSCKLDGTNVSVDYPLPKREANIFTAEIHGMCDAVYVGNPHLVCFTDRIEELEQLAPTLENHPNFPNRTNVGFVQVVDSNTLKLQVWERGAGLTPACGSGACAAAFAAFSRGLTSNLIHVEQPGGTLTINIEDTHLTMTGEGRLIYCGEIDLNAL